MTSKEFSLRIENVVKNAPELTYMDAIIDYCEKNEIGVESASKLITKSLKEKIQVQCMKANMLKISETGKLPV